MPTDATSLQSERCAGRDQQEPTWHYTIIRPSPWTHMPHASLAVGVIDALLRGVAQVMLQNNPMTGLLFVVGIFLNSYEYGLTALLGLVVATLAAYLLGADQTLIRDGLFGFNGVLTGITLSVFLQWDCTSRSTSFWVQSSRRS